LRGGARKEDGWILRRMTRIFGGWVAAGGRGSCWKCGMSFTVVKVAGIRIGCGVSQEKDLPDWRPAQLQQTQAV